MKITVEKESKPFIVTRPWVIKLDGRQYGESYKTKKKAIDVIEATGNKVTN